MYSREVRVIIISATCTPIHIYNYPFKVERDVEGLILEELILTRNVSDCWYCWYNCWGWG